MDGSVGFGLVLCIILPVRETRPGIVLFDQRLVAGITAEQIEIRIGFDPLGRGIVVVQGQLEKLDGLVVVAADGVEAGPVVGALAVHHRQGDADVVVGLGLLAHAAVDAGQGTVRQDVFRADADHVLEGPDGPLEQLLHAVHQPEVVVVGLPIGADGDRPLEGGSSLFITPNRLVELPERIPGPVIGRVDGTDLLIDVDLSQDLGRLALLAFADLPDWCCGLDRLRIRWQGFLAADPLQLGCRRRVGDKDMQPLGLDLVQLTPDRVMPGVRRPLTARRGRQAADLQRGRTAFSAGRTGSLRGAPRGIAVRERSAPARIPAGWLSRLPGVRGPPS